jgi:hypothetical protein
MPEMGGLKGETAPGDAHPYLALFRVLRRAKPPARRRGFSLLSLATLGILPFHRIRKTASELPFYELLNLFFL